MSNPERPDILLVGRCIPVHPSTGEILQIRRSGSAHNNGLWEFPGGKVDMKENISQGIGREVEQETGLKIGSVSNMTYVVDRLIEDGPYEGSLYLMLCGVARVIGGRIRMSSEHDKFAWRPARAVAKNRYLTGESRESLRLLGTNIPRYL